MNKDDLFRISLKAVIKNDAGEILVVRERGQDKWGLPGGGMDHAETYHEALARELHEEVGYQGDFTMKLIDYRDPLILANRENEIWQTRILFEVNTENNEFSVGSDGEELKFVGRDEYVLEEDLYERLVYNYFHDTTNSQ